MPNPTIRQKPAGKPGLVSLPRALSKLGLASRTVAAHMIEEGRVRVDGRVVTDPNLRINMGRAKLAVDEKPLAEAAKHYLAVNKPRGLATTARDERGAWACTAAHCNANSTNDRRGGERKHL